jgi:hypothetical protein
MVVNYSGIMFKALANGWKIFFGEVDAIGRSSFSNVIEDI